MSASNWNICPNCKKLAIQQRKELERRSENSYGKVSAKDYNDMVRALQKPIELADTLREDYGFSLYDNKLHVSYYCMCDACSFKFEHKAEIPLGI